MRKILAAAGATLAAAVLTLTGGTSALAAPTGVIYVPEDFNSDLSDTRATGHYEVVATGLHIWTTPTTTPGPNTNKVAEYVDTDTPLADVGEPALNQTRNSGSTIAPGFQLVVDFGDDSTADGILVGEPGAYGINWWLNNAAEQFVKDDAPRTGTGSGSNWFGTLDEWREAFPDANVVAFGFSLGSGVTGDWTIHSIKFAETIYTFAEHVKLTSKDQCKNGGWATSTQPKYKNQGECVSSFASTK